MTPRPPIPGESGRPTHVLESFAQPVDTPAARRRSSAPRLRALRDHGAAHLYLDTADAAAASRALELEGDGGFPAEFTGNTVNQPLVREVAEAALDAGDPVAWSDALRAAEPPVAPDDLLPELYAILCARLANDARAAFGGDDEHAWQTSLQLHMDLAGRPEAARRVGEHIARMAPHALVKVPFTPDHPGCLLVARDLTRRGIPVNLTSTFSARQALTGALLANVARTNVFIGRIGAALDSDAAGPQVGAAAQRALHALRREGLTDTRLIIASVRSADQIRALAGCDCFTAPPDAWADLLAADAPDTDAFGDFREQPLPADLDAPDGVTRHAGPERLAALHAVDDGFVEFLRAFGRSDEFQQLEDGDALAARFERAGFGDVFHAPDAAARRELDEHGKLPKLDGALAGVAALDTHFSLAANADFARHQEAVDAAFRAHLGGVADTRTHKEKTR